MAFTKVNSSILILAAALVCALASPLPAQSEVPEGLVFLGATQTKELYITYPNITGDFTYGLSIGCPLRFNMRLAAVETTEEVEIINNYWSETEGDSSQPAWTSAVSRIGMIPAHWASNGLKITEYPASISGPWPAGAGSSPTYANYNCVTIRKICNRPPGSPEEGCFPSASQFMYSVCDVQNRYICERPVA